MLVAGVDSNGPHIYETCPSGNVYEYYAYALGERSQSSKTYIEKFFETFPEASRDELIEHGVRAASKALSVKTMMEIKGGAPLTPDNCSIAVVGVDECFEELSATEKAAVLAAVNSELLAAAASQPSAMDITA